MLPDTYACSPAIKSETAVLAGSGPPTLLVEPDADRGGAFSAGEASREELVDGDDCVNRPVSMTATPLTTTHPVIRPTVFHGIGLEAETGTSCRATSGSPHRRHLTRPLFTFAPHAAQMTAAAAKLSHLSPGENADADLPDAVVVVVGIAEHLDLVTRREYQMLIDNERCGRSRA